MKLILEPMAKNGLEPIGSMGTDTPIAVLSSRSRLLFDYFAQLFAQVTNPPLDAIREELVTAVSGTLGPEGNLLNPQPSSCRQIVIEPTTKASPTSAPWSSHACTRLLLGERVLRRHYRMFGASRRTRSRLGQPCLSFPIAALTLKWLRFRRCSLQVLFTTTSSARRRAHELV